MTQPAVTPQQQQERTSIQEIAQYTGAKWGRPAILLLYGGPNSSDVMSVIVGAVTESQLLVGGAELTARSEWMRRIRFTQQLNQPGA